MQFSFKIFIAFDLCLTWNCAWFELRVLCGIVGSFILLRQWNIVSTDCNALPLQATLEQSLQLRVFEKSLVKVRVHVYNYICGGWWLDGPPVGTILAKISRRRAALQSL